MAVMRDVDFLLAALVDDPLPASRPMVYRYRSGALRPRMIAALRELAARRGYELKRERPPLRPGFEQATVWFDRLLVFDWPARTLRPSASDPEKPWLTATELGASLALLSTSLDGPGIHFVEYGSKVDRHPGWDAIRQGALVIEEPVITRESLQPVLRYLAATTDLGPRIDLLGQNGFVSSFVGLIEERTGLPAVVQAFEERVLLCTDPATQRYDDARYRRHIVGRQGRRVPLQHLRDLVALRREENLLDLLCAFDERRAERGWSTYRLVVLLYKATCRLLEPVSDRRPVRSGARARVAPHRITEGAVLWAALLLAWEGAFIRNVREDEVGYRRGPDSLVPALAGFGRDFLAREDRAEGGDPLDGRWFAVGCSLSRCGTDDADDHLVAARCGLMRTLNAALARGDEEPPDWFRHLHEGVSAACARLDAKAVWDEEREGDAAEELPPLISKLPPAPLHRTFATVIGRKHTVLGLSRHARERTDGVDILLHGPAGVGKQELARSYARIVLCTQPSSDGAACCICESCRAIERGDGGRIEVDGADPNIGRLVNRIVTRVQTKALLIPRYVFVIRNADRCPPEAFDKLLKSMEDSRLASFVLLARERAGVRLAGQSRCSDYRVRPLERGEAEQFVREVLTARGLLCDEAVIKLLVDVGEGIPQRLLDHCDTVTEMGSAGLGEIRERLGLEWVGALVADWPEIVAEAQSIQTALGQWPGRERAERVRRIQAVLQWVSLPVMTAKRRDWDGVDPALLCLDEGLRESLIAGMARQADREGTTAETVWVRLVKTWMADRLSHGWCGSLVADAAVNA